MGAASALQRVELRLHAAVRDLEMALAFYEAARIPHMDNRTQERFADTLAGHTFVALRSASLFQAALTVMRLWDRDDDSASILRIAVDLKSDSLLDSLAARALEKEARIWGPSISTSTHASLVECRDAVLRLADDRIRERLARLRAYRNKRLAHRDPFDGAKVTEAQTAEVRDITVVLAASCFTVRHLRRSIAGVIYRPRDVRLIRRHYSEAFWRIPLKVERSPYD